MRKVMDILREYGWHQGSMVGPDSSFCILGALQRAYGRTDLEEDMGMRIDAYRTYRSMRNRLNSVAQELFPDRIHGCAIEYVAAVNDHPKTTLEDIELICKHAEV